jgi:hypothetical protein
MIIFRHEFGSSGVGASEGRELGRRAVEFVLRQSENQMDERGSLPTSEREKPPNPSI